MTCLASTSLLVLNFNSLILQEARVYAEENGLFFMETSAKTASNVNDIFYEIGLSPFLFYVLGCLMSILFSSSSNWFFRIKLRGTSVQRGGKPLNFSRNSLYPHFTGQVAIIFTADWSAKFIKSVIGDLVILDPLIAYPAHQTCAGSIYYMYPL